MIASRCRRAAGASVDEGPLSTCFVALWYVMYTPGKPHGRVSRIACGPDRIR